jgi:hypothetical protein
MRIVNQVKEMKEKKILRNTLPCDSFIEEFKEMRKEEREIYLFLRGGFAAKCSKIQCSFL